MKKAFLTILLCVVLIIVLTGCGMRNKNKQNLDVNRIMIVFLESDVSSEDIEKIAKDIEKMNNIKNVQIKSKEEIKKEFMESNETFKEVLSELEDNPLSDEIIVEIKPDEDIKAIADKIKEFKGVQTIKY